jgi:hypothetical protein
MDKELEELQRQLAEKKEQEQATEQESPIEEDTSESPPKQDLTLATMTYNEVTEMAKKANLMATSSDKDFVGELSEKNKDVLKSSIDLEREKVEAEKQRILLEQEKIAKEKEENLNERLKGKFGAKLDAQEYYYKSLQPILETVGVKKPMNVWLMWIIAVMSIVIPIYPTKLLFCATFGNLLAGASSENRKGFAKGCMWTAIAILGISMTALLVFGMVKLGTYLFG